MRAWGILSGAVCVAAMLGASSRAEAATGQVKAGVAKVDATWHVGASAGQYASEDTPAEPSVPAEQRPLGPGIRRAGGAFVHLTS